MGGRDRRQGPGPRAAPRAGLREPALRPPGLLDRGSARHRADRAAARGRTATGCKPGRRRCGSSPAAGGPHPGAQLPLFQTAGGWRCSLWATNLPADTRGWRGRCACADAAHRVHARAGDVIRTGKDTGLGHFPSHDYKASQSWLDAAMTACILLAWLRLTALDGDLARAEPKTLRYRILHAAARLTRGGRRRRWKFPANWPWAEAITRAWQRICALPEVT